MREVHCGACGWGAAPRPAALINGQMWPLSGQKQKQKRPAGRREKENTCGGGGALPFSISRRRSDQKAQSQLTAEQSSLSAADRRFRRAQWRSGGAPKNQNRIWPARSVVIACPEIDGL